MVINHYPDRQRVYFVRTVAGVLLVSCCRGEEVLSEDGTGSSIPGIAIVSWRRTTLGLTVRASFRLRSLAAGFDSDSSEGGANLSDIWSRWAASGLFALVQGETVGRAPLASTSSGCSQAVHFVHGCAISGPFATTSPLPSFRALCHRLAILYCGPFSPKTS